MMNRLTRSDAGSKGFGQFTVRVQYDALEERMSHHNFIFYSRTAAFARTVRAVIKKNQRERAHPVRGKGRAHL